MTLLLIRGGPLIRNIIGKVCVHKVFIHVIVGKTHGIRFFVFDGTGGYYRFPPPTAAFQQQGNRITEVRNVGVLGIQGSPCCSSM
jgi:hypothetical protein